MQEPFANQDQRSKMKNQEYGSHPGTPGFRIFALCTLRFPRLPRPAFLRNPFPDNNLRHFTDSHMAVVWRNGASPAHPGWSLSRQWKPRECETAGECRWAQMRNSERRTVICTCAPPALFSRQRKGILGAGTRCAASPRCRSVGESCGRCWEVGKAGGRVDGAITTL